MLRRRLHQWQDKAERAGHPITRLAVAYAMAAIPTLDEEDRRRPNREHQTLSGEKTRIINRLKGALIRLGIRDFNPRLRNAADRLEQLRTREGVPLPPNTLAQMRRDIARLRFVSEQARAIEKARLDALRRAPQEGPHAMVLLLARIIGVGVETADMLVNEALDRDLRDRRAVARYAGSPDESGAKRREKGLAKAGNARVQRGMLQLPLAPERQRSDAPKPIQGSSRALRRQKSQRRAADRVGPSSPLPGEASQPRLGATAPVRI